MLATSQTFHGLSFQGCTSTESDGTFQLVRNLGAPHEAAGNGRLTPAFLMKNFTALGEPGLTHKTPVQYSTVQYSTVQYSTVQYSTVQYSTVQYSTVQYSTVQYSNN
jgi:hypothetical protein